MNSCYLCLIIPFISFFNFFVYRKIRASMHTDKTISKTHVHTHAHGGGGAMHLSPENRYFLPALVTENRISNVFFLFFFSRSSSLWRLCQNKYHSSPYIKIWPYTKRRLAMQTDRNATKNCVGRKICDIYGESRGKS